MYETTFQLCASADAQAVAGCAATALNMPTLDWIGKKAVLDHQREVPYRLLRCNAELSAGDPDSGNLLVQAPIPNRASGKTPLRGAHNGKAVYLLFNGVMGDKRPQGGNVMTSEVSSNLPRHPNGDGVRVIYGEGCRLGAARLKREGLMFKQVP